MKQKSWDSWQIRRNSRTLAPPDRSPRRCVLVRFSPRRQRCLSSPSAIQATLLFEDVSHCACGAFAHNAFWFKELWFLPRNVNRLTSDARYPSHPRLRSFFTRMSSEAEELPEHGPDMRLYPCPLKSSAQLFTLLLRLLYCSTDLVLELSSWSC